MAGTKADVDCEAFTSKHKETGQLILLKKRHVQGSY